MTDRHPYFLELIEYILESYLELPLDLSRGEALLPKVRIDLLIEIPEAKLPEVSSCPLPVLTEYTLVK